jgi:transcriptional regulator with XRE-family HTH domain
MPMKVGAENIQTAFGDVLREARTAKGFSQKKLALERGLDRTYIALLERGLRQPTLTTLFLLSGVLQTAPSRLVAKVERALP